MRAQLIETLLLDLQSTDPRARDLAALELMERGDVRAVPALLSAIAKPENANHRGTLVYALSAFDPSEHLEFLTTLALTGNFEASIGALSILENASLSTASRDRIRAHLTRPAHAAPPEGHHIEALEALQKLFRKT